MESLISVIVPVYNVENYLDKCIESIVNQTYKNLEIILVDDGSLDSSSKICDEWAVKDNRIKVIHKTNGGVSSARNEGLKNANGDFIAFVDSDDWLELNMYEKLISKQKETNTDIVFSGYNMIIDGKTWNINESVKSDFCKTKDILYLLRHQNLSKDLSNRFTTKNNINCLIFRFLFKKGIFNNINFDESLSYMEDVRLLTEIFLNKDLKVDFINDYLYNYLIRESSLSHGNLNKIIEKSEKFLISIEKILKDTQYEKYILAEKFYAYYMCKANKIKSGSNESLKNIKIWNKHKNYKVHKKLCNGLSSKLKAFMIHYHLSFILKIAYKIKK